MAVTPAHAADGAKVDATRTWALIDEMTDAGVPKTRIAEHLGQNGPLQLRRTTITARNARAVADLHKGWKNGAITLERHSRHHNGQTIAPATENDPTPLQGDDIDQLVSTLADILEERIDQAHWRQNAACRGRDVHIFFPARGDNETGQAARRICNACIVRNECAAANATKREGIYGALSSNQRRHQPEAA